jgi:hypothetical protein
MSRDTWSGDANQPMSYNKWAYTYGNPINLSDPTGMSPECDSIAGDTHDSQLKCEKIIRGLDPENIMTFGDLEAFDASGATPDCPLYMVLDMPGGHDSGDMSEDYGFWFHYMLEKTPNWWNMGGRAHTSFAVAAGFGITREAGIDSNRAGLLPILAEIFTRKSWAEGFYHMLGSRSTIRATVDSALINAAGGFNFHERNKLGSTNTFQQVLDIFATGPQGVNKPDVYKTDDNVFVEMYDALTNHPEFHNNEGGNAPYEWGNPTIWTHAHYPDLLMFLTNQISGQRNIREDQVYYRVGVLPNPPVAASNGTYPAFFALTQNQARHWCSVSGTIHSCVAAP